MHNNAQIIAKNAHFFATMSSDELKNKHTAIFYTKKNKSLSIPV